MSDFLLVSTADWDNPYWTNKQHTAIQLANAGHRVFYVESQGLRRPSATGKDATRIVRRLVRGLRSPRKVRDNIWVWSPIVIPWHSVSLIRKLNCMLLWIGVTFWSRYINLTPTILWTYSPLTTELYDTRNFELVAYHCVDDIKAQPGMPREAIAQAEAALVTRSDVIFATSPHLYETHRQLNPQTYYFPNVADYTHFNRAMSDDLEIPADLNRLPKPRIGFVGAISSYKLDFRLIKRLAESRPQLTFVFVGEVGEGDPSTSVSMFDNVSNVCFLGGREYSTLPAYLKGMDVAILPNIQNEYTRSMFPMKFFEYLGAGRPIVSTMLPALAAYHDLAAFCEDESDFLEAIDRALKGDTPPLNDRLEAAKEQTYENRTQRMLAVADTIQQTKSANQTTLAMQRPRPSYECG